MREKFQSEMEMKMALQVLEQYQNCGAVKKLLPSDFQKTRPFVLWFTLSKLEGEKQKLSFITVCRELNMHIETKNFR